MTDSPSDRITRREATLRISATALVAAAVGGGAVVFHERRSLAADAAAIPDWRSAATGSLPPAVAARGGGPVANVRRVLAALGGMERFVKPGEVVLIKPNVGWDRLPAQAADTDPQVVAELVRLCLAAGASQVVVSDNSCNDPRRCFARSGISEAAAAAGARVVSSGQIHWVHASLSGYASGLEVMGELLTADRVINVPVAKHHSLSRVTVGMKNWLGVLGRGRNRLHQDINIAMAELGAIFRPTLTVVDATRVLLANGPTGGSLADVKSVDAVAAGIDPVACDAWGAAQLGVDPRSLGFILEAERRGLGRGDARLVRELGTA
ncbi:MAG: DUF362 domain-containing protein [Acidobacteriota bacterium]